MLVCLPLLAVLLSPFAGQDRARPPEDAVETMPREVKLGRNRGFAAYLQGIEVTDRRFEPFYLRITVSGESNLRVHTARFETEFGSFESFIPKGQLPRWQAAAFGSNAPPSADATLEAVHHKEERVFQLELGQAVWLARSKTLKVTVVGRLRERDYELSNKALKRFQEWLRPRVESRLPKKVDQR